MTSLSFPTSSWSERRPPDSDMMRWSRLRAAPGALPGSFGPSAGNRSNEQPPMSAQAAGITHAALCSWAQARPRRTCHGLFLDPPHAPGHCRAALRFCRCIIGFALAALPHGCGSMTLPRTRPGICGGLSIVARLRRRRCVCTLGGPGGKIDVRISPFYDVVSPIPLPGRCALGRDARDGAHLGASLPRVAAADCIAAAGSANPQPRPFNRGPSDQCERAHAHAHTLGHWPAAPSHECCGRSGGHVHSCACR